MWIAENEIIVLKSPGLGSTYPCNINCLWIIHTSNDDFKIFVEINWLYIDKNSRLLLGNGGNPQDDGSVYASLRGSLSPGTGYVSSNSTIWIALHTDSCLGNNPADNDNGYFELNITDVNGTGIHNYIIHLCGPLQ